MNKSLQAFPRVLAVLGMSIVSLALARAESFWQQTNAGSYDWFTAANWSGGVPNGTNAIATFNYPLTFAGNITSTVSSTLTIGGLYTVSGGSGNLTVTGSNITFAGSQYGGTNPSELRAQINLTIENNLTIANTNGLKVNNSQTAWLKGNVTGSGGIQRYYGKVYLSGDNDFSGNVTIGNNGQILVTTTNGFEHTTGAYTWTDSGGAIGSIAQGTTIFKNTIDLGNASSEVSFYSGGSNNVLEVTTSSWTNTGGSGAIKITWAGTESFIGYTNPGYGGIVKFSGTDFTVVKNVVGRNTGDGSAVEFSPATGTQTWSGNISSLSGARETIIKSGAGTVVFGGTNTYTSGTVINSGTLQIGNGGTSGTLGTGNVTNSGGTLVFNRSDAISVSNIISGAGNLTMSGSGTLTLTTNSTYTGATTITAGELALGANGKLSTSSALNLSGATARLDISGISAAGSTNGSLAGAAGSVVNLGSKNLNVGGDNTSTTFAGSITNSGSLTKSGTGTLTLSGNNTFSGGMAISNGTLRIGDGGTLGTGNVTNSGSKLVFNRSDAMSVANIISGGGSLTQSGSGTVTLTATNTYTGATTVEAGKLVISGSISSSAVTTTNSGAIGGSGSVGALTIANGGTLAPGNSPGTLFAASSTWANGGRYDWEILNLAGPAGATNGWDLLDVAGTLTLTGLTNSGFTINLITLSDSTTRGQLAGFNPSATYTNWLIARADTITGFNSSLFNLYTGSFSNAYTGTFGITNGLYEGDQALFLTYTGGGAAIPEPGTWAAAALLAGTAGFIKLRRRNGKA